MIQRRLGPVLRGLAAGGAAEAAAGRRQAALETVEPRLRAIYQQQQFGENPGRVPLATFDASWLPGGSSYVTREPVAGGEEHVWAQYDAASGERAVLTPDELAAARGAPTGGGGVVSPDGQRTLTTDDHGDLLVRDQAGGASVALTSSGAESGGAVSSGRASWSPDSQRIAYVQSDSSAVRLRSVLSHDDPSYPEHSQTRFARVGEVIQTLKVGVVDAAGGETTWLPIAAPEEGWYLGDSPSWAGNSQELLVEKLSRFRDEREFLLVNVDSG